MKKAANCSELNVIAGSPPTRTAHPALSIPCPLQVAASVTATCTGTGGHQSPHPGGEAMQLAFADASRTRCDPTARSGRAVLLAPQSALPHEPGGHRRVGPVTNPRRPTP